MLKKLGFRISYNPYVVILAWVIALGILVVGAFTGFGSKGNDLFGRMDTGLPSVNSESQKADDIMSGKANSAKTETNQVYLLLNDVPDINAPELVDLMKDFQTDLKNIPSFDSLTTPIGIPPEALAQSGADSLISGKDVANIINFVVAKPANNDMDEAHLNKIIDLINRYTDEFKKNGVGDVQVANQTLFDNKITEVTSQGLEYGELISLPLALIALLLIFGGILAAITPLIGAGASILGSMGVLWILTFVMQIDTTTLNLCTVIGLALSIDFSLLMVSRYRENLRQYPAVTRRTIALAISNTMDTAGRTVLFSGITVALCLCALFAFDAPFLKAIGVAGISVVMFGVLSALTLLPAFFRIYGNKLLRKNSVSEIKGLRKVFAWFSGDIQKENGAFTKIAKFVKKAPALFLLVGMGILIFFGSGIQGLALSVYDSSYFAKNPPIGQALDHLQDFKAFQTSDVILVFPADTQFIKNDTPGTLADYENAIKGDKVSDGIDTDSLKVQDLGNNDYATISFNLNGEVSGTTIINNIRSYIADQNESNRVLVTGNKARDLDFANSIGKDAWKAIAIVALVTLILMFLLTGSILIPIMTVIFSAASLGASIGILTWGFVDGGLANILGFSGVDVVGLSPIILVLSLLFGLALSNDYGIFLSARLREEYSKLEHENPGGKDNADLAIINGLQHTGRIISSAGTLMILVFLGFAFSGVVSTWFEGANGNGLILVEEIGLSLTAAVSVDAFLIRPFMVPAFMFLFGRSMWSAPEWLTELYHRFGIKHG